MQQLMAPIRVMETLAQDVRYAIRQLRARPGFAAVTVITLTLGIGASTTVFSIANWIAFRPVPGVRDQGRLVTVEFLDPRERGLAMAPAVVEDIGAGTTAFEGIAAYNPGTAGIVVGQARGRTVQIHFTTEDYFSVLGVDLVKGSAFTTDQARAAVTTPVGVISHGLWMEAFRGAEDVVGRILTVNGLAVEVVGVARAGFRGPRLLGEIDLWAPGAAQYALLRIPPPAGDPTADRTRALYGHLIARLAPNATTTQAEAQVGLVIARLAETPPSQQAALRGRVPHIRPGIGVPPRARETVERMIVVLVGIGAVMIAIALGNATNLSVFRTLAGREPLMIQRALGASAWRIVRQRVAESLILSMLSGGLAAAATVWLVGLFRGRLVPGLETIETGIHLDWRVFGFAVIVAALVGVLLGALPAFWDPPSDLAVELKSGSAARGSRGAGGLRRVLTVGQLALSLALLVGALLFVGTLRNLQRIDVGMDPRQITTLWTNLPAGGYDGARARQLVVDLTSRLSSEPGIADVAFANSGPFFGIATAVRLRASSQPLDTTRFYPNPRVSPGYFRTLGLPLLRGRTFSDAEVGQNGSDRVIVLSAGAAHRFFGSEDPIGRLVVSGRASAEITYRVVGVVEDSRWSTALGEYAPQPYTYVPLGDGGWGSFFIMTRWGGTSAFSGRVKEILAEVAPSMPVFRLGTVADQIEYNLTERRLLANAALLCTILAVALAGVGLYAVVAFSVAERRREMGIRLALGAQARQIREMILREGAVMGALGVGGGLVLAAGLSRLVASRLYGLSAIEPAVYLLAAALLLAVVALASLIPARTATKVNPIIALRSE